MTSVPAPLVAPLVDYDLKSGLQLPGLLDIKSTTLDVTGQTLTHDIMYDIAATARTAFDHSAGFTYFIEATYNLNGDINYVDSHTTDGADDAYSLNKISVMSATAQNILLSLPSIAGQKVDAGMIDVYDNRDPSNKLGDFEVELTVGCNNQGILSASATILGLGVSADGENQDLPNFVQKAYWPAVSSEPAPLEGDADVFNTVITSAELNADPVYSGKLAAIAALYTDVNVIASWSITMDAMPATTNNHLSQHARFLGKKGDTNVFAAGEKMVAASPFQYVVQIKNYLDVATPIVTGSVYGVLKQS